MAASIGSNHRSRTRRARCPKIAHAGIDVVTRFGERHPPRPVIQHGDRHVVFGESAGLVHAQHRGGTDVSIVGMLGSGRRASKAARRRGVEPASTTGIFSGRTLIASVIPRGPRRPSRREGRIQEHHRQTEHDSSSASHWTSVGFPVKACLRLRNRERVPDRPTSWQCRSRRSPRRRPLYHQVPGYTQACESACGRDAPLALGPLFRHRHH